MSEIKKVQESLLNYLTGQKYFKGTLRYSGVLLYIFAVKTAMYEIPFPPVVFTILNYIAGILYFVYIAGLIMCFAKRDMLPVAVVFGVKAITYIIDIVTGNFYFNAIVYLIAYAFLAYVSFKQYSDLKKETQTSFGGSNFNSTTGSRFCLQCGIKLSSTATFCSGCGTKFE